MDQISFLDAEYNYQKSERQTRSRDAPDQERQSWRIGMKAHIGVDAESGVVHSMTTTPANHHDITQADQLLHGEEKDVFGDSGYRGIEKREEH